MIVYSRQIDTYLHSTYNLHMYVYRYTYIMYETLFSLSEVYIPSLFILLCSGLTHTPLDYKSTLVFLSKQVTRSWLYFRINLCKTIEEGNFCTYLRVHTNVNGMILSWVIVSTMPRLPDQYQIKCKLYQVYLRRY